jgi:hypothetical protein
MPGNYHVGCGMIEESLEDGLVLRDNLTMYFNAIAEILASWQPELAVEADLIVEAGITKVNALLTRKQEYPQL